MIKIGIVEDDVFDQTSLKEMTEEFFASHFIENQISVFSSVEEYLNFQGNFDLLYLDIMLGNKTGMDLAKKIRANKDDVTIVFVTSLMSYATEGYSVDASAYILKPLSKDEFKLKMEWVLKKLNSKLSSKIVINAEDGVVALGINKINYIEVFGHYLTYHLDNKEYKVRQTLANAEQSLANYGFFRISKYCLVNVNKIDKFEDNSLYIGSTELSISRSKKQALKKKILASVD